MKTIIITFVLALVFAMPVAAQNRKNSSRPNQTEWLKGVRDYKHDLLVKEMELTKAQQDEFFPLYTQMEEEIFQANKQARDLENKISNSKEPVSDLEYAKAAEALSEVSMTCAKIEEEYFKKFAKILSSKQLFQLKRAENRFAKSMISHSKQAQNSKRKQ
ncbi:MAG: hypothetical protein ACI4AH_07370 [Muribaculaceae bacterium]